MTDKAIPQVDHLLLLVGGNPLPNAVAGQLLAAPEATIWLLHSDGANGEPSTKKTAENLEQFLGQKNTQWTINLEPIPSSDNIRIENRLQQILKDNKINGRVGLHYTGGTKSMSVHVYRFLEKAFADASFRPTFSYLDPRHLTLRIDGHGTENSEPFFLIKDNVLRQQLQMTPDELAGLHGYERVVHNVNWAKPEETPGLMELCQEIARLNSTQKGHLAWKQWVYKEQHKVLPTPTQNSGLEGVTAAFNQLCGVPIGTAEMVAAKLLPGKPNVRLTACQDWFRGHWLEEYVLWSIRQIANPLIHSSEKGLTYKLLKGQDDFDLDVVALIGYQLFVVSCITTSDKDRAKEHLLEAFVRARQLGGDEARMALVCCYDTPLRLESEVSRAWDAEGKVKVFGQNEMGNLTQPLADWFQKANS